MKITLDLDALVREGRLSAVEAERLKGFAAAETSALGTNVLLSLGAAAVAAGAGVLLPNVGTAIVLGAMLFALGIWLRLSGSARWDIFAQIAMVIGALTLMVGIGTLYGPLLWVKAGMTLGLTVAAIAATSGLLAALAVLMFAITIVTGTDWEPTQYLAIVIGALAALVLGLYLLSLRLNALHERLAIIAMRTAILLINAAFLLGTVFGDEALGWPGIYFTLGWALALLAFGLWAVFANRRWVVNSVAVFGAIHFFTQWFMVLGPEPLPILGGGVLLIAFGLGLARFNNWVGRKTGTPATGKKD